MISTPNAPDGLFEKIEKEPDKTCLYKRLFLDYTYGLGKFTQINAWKCQNVDGKRWWVCCY